MTGAQFALMSGVEIATLMYLVQKRVRKLAEGRAIELGHHLRCA